MAAYLYPHAAIESVNGPAGGNALYFTISVPAADRAAPYYVDLTMQDSAGHARTTAVVTGVEYQWSAALTDSAGLPRKQSGGGSCAHRPRGYII